MFSTIILNTNPENKKSAFYVSSANFDASDANFDASAPSALLFQNSAPKFVAIIKITKPKK